MNAALAEVKKIPLPAGRYAELRHLQWSDAMGCYTVRCMHCGEDWPCDDDFYCRDGRGPAAWCKACRAERAKSWWQRHPRHRIAVPDCPQPDPPEIRLDQIIHPAAAAAAPGDS